MYVKCLHIYFFVLISPLKDNETNNSLINPIKLKSATHQKTPTQNMNGRKDNTHDRMRQGQHNIPHTNMVRHIPDKSVHKTQPCEHAIGRE